MKRTKSVNKRADTEEIILAKTTIGGQGVMDGVMMRSKTTNALAVRKQSGEVATKKWLVEPQKNKFLRLPVIRGIINFVSMMVLGVQVLNDAMKLAEYSEEEFEPSKTEKYIAKKTGKSTEDVMMAVAVVVAIVMAIGLFFLLPTFITSLFQGSIKSVFLKNLIDGFIRIVIFLAYILLVGQVKDIKNVFRYHGAEHMTIACYEADLPLVAENVKKQSRLHPRCGTSYLLLVMIITTLIYSCFGWSENVFVRFGIRMLLLLPIVGISYEILMLLGKSDNIIARILRWPGMQLQRLTTAVPDEDMINIGILAFEMALGEKTDEQLEQMRISFRKNLPDEEAQNEQMGEDLADEQA